MIQDTYETKRLKLVLSNPNLSQQVADYFVRNRQFLFATEPEREDDFFTVGFQRRELEADTERFHALKGVKFWVFLKDSDEIIGMIAFNEIVMGVFQSCYLAYRLDKDEVNKGLMTEAVAKGVEIAFYDIGLHRLEANIMPKNKPSLRVAEKLNFTNEGVAKAYLKINGVWEDHIHMVLLNEKA